MDKQSCFESPVENELVYSDQINTEYRSSIFNRRRVLAFAASCSLVLSGLAIKSKDSYAVTDTPNPVSLSIEASSLVKDTVSSWSNHQMENGDFLDPSGLRGGGYGVSMIGQAMIETGVAEGNTTLESKGLNALDYSVKHPTFGGFEAFSIATSYIWNEKNAGSVPGWSKYKTNISNYFYSLQKFNVGSGALACYTNSNCWTNLKLVEAFAKIETSSIKAARASNNTKDFYPKLDNETKNLLIQASRNTGNDAYQFGGDMKIKNAGILSDPPLNPLAYNNLSAMILGHIIESIGPKNTPSVVNDAFIRCAKSIIGLMAPDGDASYIGRGQGQVWSVAASADALTIAAQLSRNSVWRGRFLAGSSRAIDRLSLNYQENGFGLPLVPRLEGVSDVNYIGIDSYANSVEYNGLALWELNDAALRLRQVQEAPQESIGADKNGVFLDPSHTKFASIRKNNLWWAIHALDSSSDARYDFGIVAVEKKGKSGNWSPVLPYRPITDRTVSAGPELILSNKRYFPVGKSINVRSNGLVDIQGGYGHSPGDSSNLISNTNWVFESTNDTINMSFTVKPHQEYQFENWYPEGSKVIKGTNNMVIEEPNGQNITYSSSLPIQERPDVMYHSAYNKNLSSMIMKVHTNSNTKVVRYSIRFS